MILPVAAVRKHWPCASTEKRLRGKKVFAEFVPSRGNAFRSKQFQAYEHLHQVVGVDENIFGDPLLHFPCNCEGVDPHNRQSIRKKPKLSPTVVVFPARSGDQIPGRLRLSIDRLARTSFGPCLHPRSVLAESSSHFSTVAAHFRRWSILGTAG